MEFNGLIHVCRARLHVKQAAADESANAAGDQRRLRLLQKQAQHVIQARQIARHHQV